MLVGGILLLTLSPDRTIRGRVLVADGTPVVDAIVRIQATNVAVRTAADGGFVFDSREAVRLSAWAPGYYITGGEEHAPARRPSPCWRFRPPTIRSMSGWAWRPAAQARPRGVPPATAGRVPTCRSLCLSDEWLQTLTAGPLKTPLPHHVPRHRRRRAAHPLDPIRQQPGLRRVPLPPDPTLPYYGPGYVLDFPDTSGNCATCHAPMAATDDPYGVDPHLVGVETEGIGCDFCHKVWDVVLDPATAVPLPNRPGVLSIEFLRPPDGHQFFAGPFDDVAPGEDTYSPLQRTSAYCAPCHPGVFWDTVVYDSYGEWLASPYSDPETGQTCQDCHMPKTGATVFVRPDAGGLERDPQTIRSHLMPVQATRSYAAAQSQYRRPPRGRDRVLPPK